MPVNGADIVNYLKQYMGTPYVWGGEDPSGFDCSGLMVWGFNHFGISLPRVTYDQINKGQAISMNGLRVGDLIFFDTDRSIAGPDHVGIYAGDGKMLHTPRPGKAVELVSITQGYYMDRFMGGRRINGVIASGGNSTDYATGPQNKPLTAEELAAQYGWSIGFMNSHPDLKKIFDQAVKEGWTANKFMAEARDTGWFKNTSETARKAQVIEQTDPATWQAMLKAASTKLQLLATEVGAAIPDDKFKTFAENIIRTGMSDDEIRYTLGGYIKFMDDGTLRGSTGMNASVLKQYAAQMGVDLSEEAVKNQAAMISQKLQTIEDSKSQIREQAKSAFPGYAEQIDGGITVAELAAPYQNVKAKELELPVDQSLDDPQIRQALNAVNQDGKPQGLPLWQFTDQVRSDPRWKQTQNAQSQMFGVGKKVLKDMGLTS